MVVEGKIMKKWLGKCYFFNRTAENLKIRGYYSRLIIRIKSTYLMNLA